MKLTTYGFKPGASGNPSGLSKEMSKKISECRMRALEECPAILDVLATVSKGGFDLSRYQFLAMKELLDRGLGRAHMGIQELQHNPEESVRLMDLTNSQIKMLAESRTSSFLINLYESGKLKEIVKKLDTGWRGGVSGE